MTGNRCRAQSHAVRLTAPRLDIWHPCRMRRGEGVLQGKVQGFLPAPIGTDPDAEPALLRRLVFLFVDLFDDGAARRTGHLTAIDEHEANFTVRVVDLDIAVDD